MTKNKNTNFQYIPLGSFINIPFTLTVKRLLAIGRVLHLTYNAVNIIVWYMLLPLAWVGILDYKIHKLILSPLWLLLCISIVTQVSDLDFEVEFIA